MSPDGPASHLAFLAAAGDLLSSSLDYQETLQHVARLAVPALGDMCMVDVMEGEHLCRVANAHVSPVKADLIEQLARLHREIEHSPTPAGRVLASGKTEWLQTVTLDVIASHTIDAEHARLIAALGVRSHVAVPMIARGTCVGVISIGITESDRRLDAADVALAEELARRAATAVDNARLYRSARQELRKREQVEEKLLLSERRFRAIVEQSPLSTQILSPDGRTVGINRAWSELWGLSLEELDAYSVLDDPQLDARGITPLLRRAFAGESVELPTFTYLPDSSLFKASRPPVEARWVRAFAYAIKDDTGTVNEVVLLHQDVSAAERAAALLRSSEDRLQRALSIGNINAWDWDLGSDIVTCSMNARKFWGIDVGNASDFLSVVHPDDLDRVNEAARAAIDDQRPYEVSYRLMPDGGQLRWVKSHGRLETDAAGTPVRMLGMTLDVTSQERADAALRMLADAGEKLGASLDYQATLAGLGEVVIPAMADWYAVDLLSDDGELERINVSHSDPGKVDLVKELQLRYPPARNSTNSSWRVIKSGQPEWSESITDQQLVEGAFDGEHLQILRSLQLKSYIAVPLRARGATIGALTLVFAESGRRYRDSDVELAMDLARRAAVAVDNARLYQQLQLADRRKDEFLAMLAHELRNPLAPISTAAQLLRLAAGNHPLVSGASDVISRQVAHMTELVDDLLDVSRVTRGLIELDRKPVDIQPVIEAAVEQIQPAVDAKGQNLVWSIADTGARVDGDRARLIQVVTNLLNNASKYTPQGGQIGLRLDADGDRRIRLSITDNGAGIEPGLLPHIFELFTQGQRSPDRSQGGLGIGLALVRRIVQLHGGEVTVHSAGLGLGSCFTVILPRAPEPAESPVAVRPEPMPLTMTSRRILLVDDNIDAAELLAEVLRHHGHRVQVAATGQEALQLITDSSKFDVHILDIGLPDITGYELAGHLRTHPGREQMMVIALTGYGQPEDRVRSSKAGFDHHLVKPTDVDNLLRMLSGNNSKPAVE